MREPVRFPPELHVKLTHEQAEALYDAAMDEAIRVEEIASDDPEDPARILADHLTAAIRAIKNSYLGE